MRLVRHHPGGDPATTHGRRSARRAPLALLAAAGLFATLAPGAHAAPGETADLSVSLSGPGVAAIQSVITYTIVVTNHGPKTASDVRVVDALVDKPSVASVTRGSTIIGTSGAAGGCSIDPAGMTAACTLGAVAGGAGVTITVSVFTQVNTLLVVQPAEATIVDTATVASAGGELDTTPADNVQKQTTTLVPGVSVDDPRITQPTSGTTTLNFTVYLAPGAGGRGGGSYKTITVDYATSDGTAVAGSDYVATSGTLTFSPTQTLKTVSVTINGESPVESPSEDFHLDLSNATNAIIIRTPGDATLTP